MAADAKRAGGDKTFYDFPACYYRVHLDAPVRFNTRIRCGIEHGGVNDADSDYASLAFWYQIMVGASAEDIRLRGGLSVAP